MDEEAWMRKRGLVLVFVLILAMISTVVGVSAQTSAEPGEIGRVITSFMQADASGDLVVANDPAVNSVFGGTSQLPADVQDRTTIVETIEFTVQPGPGFGGFDPDGVDIAVSNEGPDGVVETQILSLPLTQNFFTPVQEGGAPLPDEFFDVVFDLDLTQDNLDDFQNGVPFDVNGATIVPPASGGPPNFNGPLVVRGARFASPPPPGFCPGEQFDFFTGDAVAGDPTWTPADFAPQDTFGGLSQAHVNRCVDNEMQPTQFLVNNGSQFNNQDTDAFAVLDEGAFFLVIPLNEIAGSTATRTGMFITPSSGGFQADNVGFTTAPDYPELRPVDKPTVLIAHPWATANLHPLGLTFSEGSNGSPGFAGNYGVLVDTKDESGETNEFSAMMIQLDSYQLSFGTFTYDPTDGTYSGELEGSGDSYTEKIMFMPDMIEYTYDPGSPEMYAVSLEPGGDVGLIAEMAGVYEEREAAAVPPPTTTTVAPTTTAAATDTTSGTAGTPGGGAEAGDESGSSIVLILLGILILLSILGLLWWLFFAKKKPDPCHELYLAWQKAKKACEKATAEAKAKRKAADDAAAATKKAEKAKKDHCRAFPPACGPQSSATDVDSGRTVTRDDLHVQRQWSQHAWGEYRAANQSAQETQDQWNTPPPADFRAKAQEALDAAKAKTPGLDKAIADAKQAEKDANEAADKAEKAAEKACADAATAKQAYDDCVGAASAAAAVADGAAAAAASAAGAAVGGVAGAAAAAQAAGQGGGKNCDPQQRAYDSAKKACDEAKAASDKAAQAAKDADRAVEHAEKALEDLCDEYPPLCRDDWIEESGNPGSRVTTKDLFLQDVWADQVWLDYQNDDISAQEASDRWSQDPPANFAEDELRKLEEARPLKPIREKAIKDAKAKADTARADAKRAKKKADTECAKADAAKRALDACLAAGG